MADRLDTNVLYYGDNLDILRSYIPDESVDLIYLDPPFNSNRRYNVLFKESEGTPSGAQIQAFSDTWHWDRPAEQTYNELVLNGPPQVSRMIEAMRELVGSNDLMAYLVMMTIRMVELHRILQPAGSIYLHCDPTASHYLKIMLDAVFGKEQFRNEIVWKRSHAHSKAKRYGPVHDVLLFYSKSNDYLWTDQRRPYDEEYVKRYFKFDEGDGRGRYWTGDLTGSGIRRGETGQPWRGFDPTEKGRHWMNPPDVLDRLDRDNRIYWPKSATAWPKLKRYLSEARGAPLQDIFDDVYSLQTMGGPKGERLGYQTQKPLALLERIIKASSNEGDLVLDPFCGCGTAVVASQNLGRRWVGIDITHLAITVMRKRLEDSFPGLSYEVVGEPKDLAGARALALQDRYQFQWWALSLVNALPVGGVRKKGADQGIDGIIRFIDNARGRSRRVIVQVKSGRVGIRDIRELKAVAGENDLGLFLTLQPPTEPMLREAVTAGFHHSPLWQRDFPRIQIITVEQLLSGESPVLPITSARIGGFAKAPKLNDYGSQMTIAEHQKAYTP